MKEYANLTAVASFFDPPALRKGEASRRLYDTRVPVPRNDQFLHRKVIAQFWAIKAGPPFEQLASLLVDYKPATASHLVAEENRPANPKRLNAIAYELGFSSEERERLHRWAEHVQLTDRFAGHLLGRARRGRAGE